MTPLIKTDTLIRFLAMGTGLLLLVKLYLAARLDLYSDEVFYWLASTRPALAYSDLPAITALMTGLGSALDGNNTLATRLLFILMGSSVPGLVYWLARPFTDRNQALQSSALAICIPLGGFLGLLAVPDVPLLFFGLLAIGFFDRALRTDRLSCWLLTGIAVALGFSTHYRFLLYPAAALLFLLFYPAAREQWRKPGLWLAAAVGALGLVPIIWVNIENRLASASFYFLDRHPWEFQPTGLLHLFKQAGVVTPPLYIILLITLWQLVRNTRDGNRDAALLLSFAAVNLLVYLLLAPWTDANSTSLHWPLSGYFPLLVFAPRVLASVYQWLTRLYTPKLARKLVMAIPVLGFVGTLTALVGIGSQAFQTPLQALVGRGALSNKMAGWRPFADHTATLLQNHYGGRAPVIVTDNYYTAAQVEYAGLSVDAITIDNKKAARDGRLTQFRLWDKHTDGLQRYTDAPVLFITEDSTLNVPDKQVLVGEMCRHVSRLEVLDQLVLFGGDKHFTYYRGMRLPDSQIPPDYRASPCPYPAWAWIDPPVAGAVMRGTFHIEGWAYKEDIGIESVFLQLDGATVAELDYGHHRPDVVQVMGVQSDPNAPNLGYSHELDTRRFADGEYTLAIELVDRNGVATLYGERRVTIDNSASL